MKPNFLLTLFLPLAIVTLFALANSLLLGHHILSNFESSRVNLSVFGIFLCISVSYIYIYKRLEILGFILAQRLAISILVLVFTVFIFSNLIHYYFFNTWNVTVAFYQAILSSGILIFNILFWYFISVKFSQNLIFDQKSFFYVKMIVSISVFLSVLVILMTYSSSMYGISVSHLIALLYGILGAPTIITIFTFIILYGLNSINYLKQKIILLSIFTIIVSFAVSQIIFNTFFANFYISSVVLLSICTFVTIAIIAVLLYFQERRKQVKLITNLKYSFSQKQAEYLQLKHQVSPHFLFNNLNTLIAFIEINPTKAIDFAHNLSNVYRHYFTSQSEDFVPLKDELNFIDNYLNIYKAKFESAFVYKIENKVTSEFYILSSTLQELIDNVFKHNILDDNNPLIIDMKVVNDYLIVSNSKHSKQAENSDGTGLANISKRYELLSGKRILILNENDNFSVSLPVLKIH